MPDSIQFISDAFVLLLTLFDGEGLSGIVSLTAGFAILMLVFFLIGGIAYLLVAASFGWKYTVLFEMDETKVVHIQTEKQFKKAQAIGWLAMLAGFATNHPAGVGQGLMIAARDRSTSVFANVSTVKVRRRRNVIYVNQLLSKNQVYAADEDFHFVADYILRRCVNAKEK